MIVMRAWRALREFAAQQRELQERMLLLNRPWENVFLHWSGTGDHCELHGTVVPPRGRRLGVTAGGWCGCGGKDSVPGRNSAVTRSGPP